MHAKLILLLGSNIGDRLGYLDFAKEMIVKNIGGIINISGIYETEAWGIENQEAFLNQVIIVDTKQQPKEILKTTQYIEKRAGRIRKVKWGERTLDIDILFIDDQIINVENLIVPHPYLHERLFTLAPLNEIASDFVHPVLHKSISELYELCDKRLKVNKLSAI